MNRVFVDVRALQDPAYAPRGIGRHCLNILRNTPAHLALVGLFDPALPALSDEVAGLLSEMHSNAGHDLKEADAFVQLSPLTHDPLFVSRFLTAPSIPKLTALYDFIPMHDPALYLKSPAARATYAIRLRWLAAFDLYCPISRTVSEELQNRLGISQRAIYVTGAPVSHTFSGSRAAPIAHAPTSPYLALLAGPEPRKNTGYAVIAHAQSARLQAARVSLVIGGNYSPAESAEFRNLSAANGGDPELLRVPGYLPDSSLTALLSGAIALICPSRDEGFSLPVVEGMALGVPVLASDIPVHRELLTSPSDLFGLSSHNSLSDAAERLVFDPLWHRQAVSRQVGTWERFAAEKVARRFWGALDGHIVRSTPLKAPATIRSRPRVALITPVAPAHTGIADHSAALAREIGMTVDLDVFSPTPTPWPVTGANGVYPLTAFPHLSPAFDRVVSVMGNSDFHIEIFHHLRRYGGACIAHDSRMLGFYWNLLGEHRTVATATKELGRTVAAAEIGTWLADEALAEARFLGEMAESSSRLVVHSSSTAKLVEGRHGGVVRHLPFCIQRQPSSIELTKAGRLAARARLGIAENEIVIATFGHVNASKAPRECVWALDMLRGWGFHSTLHFVGGTGGMPDGGAALKALVARLGLEEHVRFASGHVAESGYRDYLVSADVALQLRTFDLGQISGALSDCLAAGLPAVATRGLVGALDAPGELVSAVPDELSPLIIAEELAGLLQHGRWSSRSEAARRAFCDERSAARYAARLCEALDLEVL
jgi:glycosyltransferase involved in cell wall biosynthesis